MLNEFITPENVHPRSYNCLNARTYKRGKQYDIRHSPTDERCLSRNVWRPSKQIWLKKTDFRQNYELIRIYSHIISGGKSKVYKINHAIANASFQIYAIQETSFNLCDWIECWSYHCRQFQCQNILDWCVDLGWCRTLFWLSWPLTDDDAERFCRVRAHSRIIYMRLTWALVPTTIKLFVWKEKYPFLCI